MTGGKPIIRTRGGKTVEYLSARYSDDMPPSSDGAEVLYHEYGVQLRRTVNSEYILNVLCGRVGQFAIEIILTQEELARYRANDGDNFVHELGNEIYYDPEAFEGRRLSN